MLRRQLGNSPVGLRDDGETETQDTYHPSPRVLVRQRRVDQIEKDQNLVVAGQAKQVSGKSKWPTRFASTNVNSSLKDRLSRKFARLSSLDSTRSSSSIEVESNDGSNMQQQQANRPIMPLISITTNETTSTLESQQQQSSINNKLGFSKKRRYEQYNNYYGRSRLGLARSNEEDEEEEDDEDEDEFGDPSLPIPYSSSSMSRSTIVRQQTDVGVTYPSTRESFEDLLDDRQGMNSGEQQFTKGEKADRHSIDGSIISELRLDGKRASTSGKNISSNSKKDSQKRSKSPSSSSFTRRNRHSRRGFLGLASRLKLTRKHDSIAKLQLSILNSGFISLKSLDKDLQTFLPKDRMNPKEFEERVKLMRKYEVLATIEYRFASRYETYVCRHAIQESNQSKNNYKKCIPYDYNRVVLKTLPNVPDSDYINASHLDSCLKPNAYIAAQGPNENTIEDFWRMIWEQKTFVIVMLTKVFDFIRVMCNQYWPVELNKPERYGNLEVTLLYEEPLADFVIRTIKLTKVKNNHQQGATDQTKRDVNLDGSGREQDDDDYSNKRSATGERKSISGEEFTSDDEDTSASDELVLNEEYLRSDGQKSPRVRSPKYLSTRSLKKRDEESQVGPRKRESRSQSPHQSPTLRSARSSSQQRETRTKVLPSNEFLYPPFAQARAHTPSSSLSSIPTSIPGTPLTPRTPSSAGLDRSSATRKAVKKKRRARVKNMRPMQTQFKVPDEAQLLDDVDDELAEGGENGEGENGEGKVASSERIIYQFHYNNWASHTCPFISSLLHFRRRVRICMGEMAKSGKTGPTVVHCNDGCGRTGTYLCIDANLELAEEDNFYEVFNYTKKMRQSRKFLIENLEQYKFVYDTIEEAMYCGKTWFPLSELHKRLKQKAQRNPITKKNEYLREYEKITRMTSKFSIGDCAGGHRVENREKNRDVSTVPPDNFRPYLTSFQTNDNTDYINAVFVDGYTRSKEYIVTEWPSHKTISDFWSLIYDHDCNSVILLANPPESSTYPSFLPSEKELRRKFGPVFSAEMVSYTHYQNIKSWIYTINKKIVSLTEVIAGVKSEAKTTQVFQITCWPQGHRVPTSTNALVELMNMVERWRQRTAYGPVCVVSLNGKSRAGVYCAANVAIEQVVQHSEVDVFQAVKTVRRHRPQLIENMTEYKYCYDLILHYVLHYVNQTPSNS